MLATCFGTISSAPSLIAKYFCNKSNPAKGLPGTLFNTASATLPPSTLILRAFTKSSNILLVPADNLELRGIEFFFLFTIFLYTVAGGLPSNLSQR